MKLNEIRTFVAVAEAQSVQEAANRLHLTQSAVSRLIQRLEAEVGATLFDRQSKPLALTRDGETALAHARRVLEAVDGLGEAFAGSGQPAGILRLGATHVLSRLLSGDALDDVRSSFPGLTVRLSSDWSNALLDQLDGGALDGALVLTAEDGRPRAELQGRRLSQEEISVVGAPDLVARTRGSLAAMNAVGWVLQPEGCRYRTTLTETLHRAGLRLNVAVESFDQELLLNLAARGVGFGTGPLRLVEGTPLAARLRPVAVDGFRLTVGVWLVRARHSGRLDRVFDGLERSLLRRLAPQPLGLVHSAAE
ncbi:LysR family transcriptional regulator [Azospirillum sp. TSO22-1]|uniref:LysR family transcriptional regulator n=1 Tax=Azospirillum sp. TSO22-1 TaxID=716789 RepID=UPI000D60F15F|nr:LysR family transcriptional regulator [Azospirillum sp. TSO22-1]PWC54773.1 transcriptional regulator [Azospirillum sp. TSO22-1]